MRAVLIGMLVAGVAASACNRENTPAAVGAARPSGVAATSAAATSVAMPGTAVATTGTAPVTLAAAPAVREITLPAGTRLPIVLDTAVGSDLSHVEEPVRAHLSHAIVAGGMTVLSEGSVIGGVVTDATRSGRVKGRAHVGMRFDTVAPRGEDARYQIRTQTVSRTAPSTKKKDALEIGAPAAGGAIIGAIVGGKKGAAIGSAVGGGAGTGVVLATRGKEVRIPRGAALVLKLAAPVTVRVRG